MRAKRREANEARQKQAGKTTPPPPRPTTHLVPTLVVALAMDEADWWPSPQVECVCALLSRAGRGGVPKVRWDLRGVALGE